MIRIVRPSIPAAFADKGASFKATVRLKAQAEAILDDGDLELSKLKFGKTHWSKASQPLELAQKSKCCFCEGPFSQSPPEVEHFRPIRACKQSRGSPQLKPGYWWLAYEWENLLIACRACNGLKSTVFPVQNEAIRARLPTDDLGIEEKILLNPAVDDPEEHIVFDRELPKSKSERGKITIETVGLDRERLNIERLKTLATVEREIQLFVDANTDAERHTAFLRLKNLCGPNASYSAMSKALLESRLPELVVLL
jgi:uncharacterized protein (TIGR02646 family)